MYYVIFAVCFILFLMILHINWLWSQLETERKNHVTMVTDGYHEGLNWGVANAPTRKVLSPGDSIFVNLEASDGAVYRIYRVNVAAVLTSQVVLETTIWNQPEMRSVYANVVEE